MPSCEAPNLDTCKGMYVFITLHHGPPGTWRAALAFYGTGTLYCVLQHPHNHQGINHQKDVTKHLHAFRLTELKAAGIRT
jgi:hypothetical protein